MIKKTLLSMLFVFAISIAFAQSTFVDGYIITLNGDTLRGQIKYNPKNDLALFGAVFFQTKPSDKKSYRPNKIKEFAFDDVVFVSRVVDDKQVFVKRLSSGAVNLYLYKAEQYLMNNIHTYLDYYMEKNGSTELTHVKESKFKKQLTEVMSDNQELIKDIQDKKYQYENIVDVFELYNKNKDGSIKG